MRSCPSDLKLTLLMEGRLSVHETETLRSHAARCPHCTRILMTAQELDALEDARLLPEVDADSYAKALRSIPRKADNASGSLRILHWLQAKGAVLRSLTTSDRWSPALADGAGSDLCAIRSEWQVLKELGHEIPLVQLVEESRTRGWYRPGHGTALKYLGNLLELHGLQVNRIHAASADDLRSEIAAGHRVIVAVDRGEMEAKTPAEKIKEQVEEFFMQKPDHAVCVFEVVQSPDGDAVRISGSDSEAFGEPVVWQIFEAAWDDSDRLLVSAWKKTEFGKNDE